MFKKNIIINLKNNIASIKYDCCCTSCCDEKKLNKLPYSIILKNKTFLSD